jgi:ABC-type oligopeptide transport system ATPase subunit
MRAHDIRIGKCKSRHERRMDVGGGDRPAAKLQITGCDGIVDDGHAIAEVGCGQRQRIAIARALSLNPKVIVADESVSALDVSIKAQVCNLLMDLQEEFNLAFLFISHDMAVVERISHRVAVMYLGESVEIGPRAAIFENPQHDYTKKLLAAVPIPDPERRGLRRSAAIDELKSPVRPTGYTPPRREYREFSEGHFVQLS